MKKRNYVILLLLLNQSIHGRIFKKAGEKTKITFNFPVSCSVYNGTHQVVWLGAGEDVNGSDAEYAISIARHMTIEGSSKYGEVQPIISPRATKKTNLFTNSIKKPFEKEVDNPLYGSACKLMILYETLPVVVLKNSSNCLYLLSEIFVDNELQRTDSSSVSRFSFHKNEIIHNIVKHKNFLYVFHSHNKFGTDDTSRLTVLQVEPGRGLSEKEDKPFVYHTFKVIASCKIDTSDDVLMGDAKKPLASFGPEVCGISYSDKLNIALSVAADESGTACGVFQIEVRAKEVTSTKKQDEEKKVAETDSLEAFEINEESLTHKIYFTSALSNDYKDTLSLPFYVANGGSFVASKFAQLHSSTAINSLILATDHSVFAFPVDQSGKIFTQGTVEDVYTNDFQFSYRNYVKRGVQNLVSSFSLQHTITDIQVAGDVVYIKDNVRRGVHSYRALFDDLGAINNWTSSEDIMGDKKLDFFFIGTQVPFIWYGYHEDQKCLFGQTMWEMSTETTDDFISAVNQALPQKVSGVQGLKTLSCNNLYQEKNMIIATGYEKAVCGFMKESDGCIESIESQTISIPGAGALVASEIAQNVKESQEWILLGGVGGLYGYAKTNGSGFGVVENIKDLFSNDRSWMKIGNFSFVRKIVKDNRNLDSVYLASNKGFYRLLIGQEMFAKPQIKELLSASILGGRFDYISDFHIDGDFAVIGTSKGLYVIEDLSDANCAPYKLELDGAVGVVNQITAVRGSELFDNLYVLSNNQYTQTSKIHRIVVKDKKCTLFADCFQSRLGDRSRGIRRSFLDMSTTCFAFFFNGAWSVKMDYPYKKEHEAIQCYQSILRSGLNTLRNANHYFKNMYLTCLEGSQSIAGMTHDKKLGVWIIFGDFGLRILS